MHRVKVNSILISILLTGMTVVHIAGAAESHTKAAPTFILPMESGQVRLADLYGKVVYLDFWASWCGPCRSSFPWMNEMQTRYGGQGLVIVAINLDKDKSLADRFLVQLPAKFNVAFDPYGTIAGQYQIIGMPTSFLIDRNGNIHQRHTGFRDKDKADLELQIRQLIQSR